jgi:poly(glycerol-phosphate) alpha-glucosyltransferase
MKIANISASVSRHGGGVSDSLAGLCRALAGHSDTQVEALGLDDGGTPVIQWGDARVSVFPRIGPQAFGFSPKLRQALLKGDFDTVHTHGIWMYPSLAALSWRGHTGRPYMVSPHGMLDPWALGNARWKKRLAYAAFEKRHLQKAGCLRALCHAEADSFRRLGLGNPIVVIPNGIDLPEDAPSPLRGAATVKTLLYVGRLHPKKGLPNLIQAFGLVIRENRRLNENWRLQIVGWDQGGHERELQRTAAEFGCMNSVEFLGPKFGEDKCRLYRNCDAFILPSYSEGLPMAVLEAWSFGKLALITDQCNLPQGVTAGAALRIAPDVENIRRSLISLAEMTSEELIASGRKARQLVANQFTWKGVAAELRDVFSWMLGGASKPASVL